MYIPAGKKPEIGERRLYLLIEGPTEISVKQAKLELQKVMDEETLRVGAPTSFGRYSVI